MPDLEGPEYSQAPKLLIPSNAPTGTEEDILNDMVNRPGPYTPYDGPKDKTLEYHFDPAGPSDNILLTKLKDGGDGQPGNGNEQRGWRGTEISSRAGSDRQEAWRRYGEMQNAFQPADATTNNAQVQPKSIQGMWDSIWTSPEVINAQTPAEKRAAVTRILNDRQSEFDAAYQTTYGDNAVNRWANDKKYTLDSMGDYVTADQLRAFGWQNVSDGMVNDLNDTLKKYDITTPARIRHFLAQCARETDKGASYTEQDYGDKTYFDDMYEGRQDLGNTQKGDGKKFRGGGGIHITGRKEYQDFADYVGDPKVMEGGADYVAEKYPWIAAGRWWDKNKMNKLADSLTGTDHDADVDKITDVVNPGDEKGRPQRKQYYKEWYPIIHD